MQSRQKKMGQLAGADSGAASQLSSLLPGCGLDRLSDAEAARLLDLLNYLDSIASSEGFSYGWRAAVDYNTECDARLLAEGPPTNH